MKTIPFSLTTQQGKTRAVTLVEMLLVIAVIGTMAVWGVNSAKDKTEITKLNSTLEQLQGLGSATRAYYESVQTQWPKQFSDIKPFLAPSLATQGFTNAYGYPFVMAQKPNINPFYVSTRVPTLLLAKKIHAALPLSTYITYGSQAVEVRLYLTTPSQISWQGANLGAKIVNMQTISIDTGRDFRLPEFSCPDGTNKKWASGIRSFSKAPSAGNGEFVSGITLCSSDSPNAICSAQYKPPLNNYLRLNMTGWTGNYSANAKAMLMQYCEPLLS